MHATIHLDKSNRITAIAFTDGTVTAVAKAGNGRVNTFREAMTEIAAMARTLKQVITWSVVVTE